MSVTSSDGANILSPLFVFTVFKKLMLAEEQKTVGIFLNPDKQDT